MPSGRGQGVADRGPIARTHLITSEPDRSCELEHVVESADAIVAVRDGRPAAGHGGTGDVVRAAQERGLPLTIVRPEGTERG